MGQNVIPVTTPEEISVEQVASFYRSQAAMDLKTIESQQRTIHMLTQEIERLRGILSIKNPTKHKIM